MTYSPPDPDPNADIDAAPGRPSTPRWVKLLAVAGLVAVLVVVVVMLIAGGQHGPGRHLPSGETPSGSRPEVAI